MKILGLAAALLVIAAAAIWSMTSSPPDGGGGPLVEVVVPDLSAQAEAGRTAFDANCAVCHGPHAVGRDGAGPPLVHKIYEPSHHADLSFVMAVEQGVRNHHWRFGDMPRIDGVTREEIAKITAYIRELQRANGIH